MTNGRRSEGLAAAARVRRDELLAIAEHLAANAMVAVLDAPAAGTTMLELASRVGTFCFTEVVVTTARVRADGCEGWGCVLGWDAEGALAAALCDARAAERVRILAQAALDDEAAAQTERMRGVAATRV